MSTPQGNRSTHYPPPRPERSIWLMLYLIGYAGISTLAAITSLNAVLAVSRRLAFTPAGTRAGVALLLAISIAGVVCAYAAWRWKAWGVYGIAALSIASPVVEIMLGRFTVTDFVQPFAQIGILFLVVRGQWDHFD